MKLNETVMVTRVLALRCDRCAQLADVDSVEGAEFLSVEHSCGYGSVFGDGTKITIDLCQNCLKDTLGQWIRSERENDDFSDHGC